MIDGYKNIVWLASYPKSGNTWFRILLSNYLSESNDPININNIDSTIIASNRTIFDNYIGTNSSDLNDQEIKDLRPHAYRSISNESKSVIYIKVHDAWEKNHLNKPIFPEDVTKGVIYLIRHPLDVAVSFAFHSGISVHKSLSEMDNVKYRLCGKTDKLHNQLTQNLLTWSKHITSWIDDSKLPIHIIRYEDLLKDTYNVFKSAIKFLNLEYSESKLCSAINNSRFEVLKQQEERYGFREKPIGLSSFFRNGSNNGWEKHFNQEQIMSFVDDNKAILERFNYSL